MPEGIIEIKDWLASNLNPSIFTLDSMEGVIVTALAVIILYRITKNLAGFVGWCVGALILIQVGHVLGFTVLNAYFPFRDIFKFDVVAALAQLFSGTGIADALLYFDAMLQYGAKTVSEVLVQVFPAMGRLADKLFESAPWGPLP